MKYIFSILVSFIVLPKSLFAQLEISTQVGTIVGSKNAPFLLRANQYGLVPLEANLGYINARIAKDYDSTKKSFDYGFAVEGHAYAGTNNAFLLPEAHVKARWKALEIYAGRKREIMGLVDTTGTMGSYIWSGNALPVPKVDIGIRDFTPILKNKFLSVKGNIAFGYLGSGDSVQNVLLHHKSLYLKLGKKDWNLKFIAGMNHQAQFGGKPTHPFYDKISNQYIDSYYYGANDLLRVLFGRSVGGDTGLAWDEIEGMPANEAGNRIGNHLGTVDLGLEFNLFGADMFLYRQSIFEDGSLYYLSNISDGLIGLTSKFNNLHLTFEYLNTTNQGGPIYAFIPELRGNDNYFNNGIYLDGWTYQGKTIGNPLLNPYYENPQGIKVNKPIRTYIYNNKVQAWNLKAQYSIQTFALSTQMIYSKNNGNTILFPEYKNQFSFLQSISKRWSSYQLNANLAFDLGEYYTNSSGLNLSFRKYWY